MQKKKVYVVWKGRKTGIFNTWQSCSEQVAGFAGAEFKAFDSREAAEAAFQASYVQFAGKRTLSENGSYYFEKTSTIGKWKTATTRPALPSLCVDAACAGVPGPVEWRGVETESSKLIFKQGPYTHGTNNIGEFLAVVQGLAWLKKENLSWPVYSDSANAISWVKAKKCRTKLERIAENAPLFALIERAEEWLASHGTHNQVMKWDTKQWGDIPADFGRK